MDKETRSEAAAIVAATRFEAWRSDVADAAGDQASDQIFEKKRVGHDNRELKKALPHTVHQKRFMGRQTSLSLPVDVGGNVSGKRAIETTEREWLRLSNSTVIERWIKAAVDYKSRVPGWPVNDSLQNRHLSYAQLAHYEYWWNSLFLQMGAFAEPLFFLDAASLSANYAGLGFVVAWHLEKAFDLKWGAQLDVSRKKRNWMSSASRSAYEGKLTCTGGNYRVLSHIVALEIALAAAFGSEMGHENGAEPKDLRYSLPLQSETFTSEMVFFLIYCRVTCGSTLGCGDVLRRVERFGKAFGCPANSRMTSAPKCSFFGK
ncbi:neprilysin-1-like [Amblyomma americanum]